MKNKRIDSRLVTILLIVFVQMAGTAMVMPILPLYAKNQFEIQPEMITLLFTAFFAAQFVAGPYLGRLSDRYGRVPILIISQIGTAISFAMIGMAESVSVLFIARILDGITGGNIIVAQAYVTDITPDEKRTQSLGYTFAMFGLGFIVGPALGGTLSAAFGARVPYFLAAVAATIVVILTWRVLDESLSVEDREHNRKFKQSGLTPVEVAKNTPLMMLLGVSFIGQFGMGLLMATFALYSEAVLFEGYPPDEVGIGVGLILAVIGVGQVIAQMVLLKPLLKRFDDSVVALIGSVLRAIGMYGFAIITAATFAAPMAILFALGTGFMMPPLQSMSTRTVAKELRGGVLGWYQSTISLATIFSTALGGFLFTIDPTLPYWLSGSMFLFAAFTSAMLIQWARAQVKPRP